MKKFGEGQQPFHAIIDIPEGDSQELTTVTDQAMNSFYGEIFNLLENHGINPTTTTNADLKQVARAVWSAVSAGNVFEDTGGANVKNLKHYRKEFLFKNSLSNDDGFLIEFINTTQNNSNVVINIFDPENNTNHFQGIPLLSSEYSPLKGGELQQNAYVKAIYKKNNNAFVLLNTTQVYLLTPEQFGAVGDGKTDDTKALQAFFKNNMKCGISKGSQQYLINDTVVIPSGFSFDGGSCTITSTIDKTLLQVAVNADNYLLQNFNINGSGRAFGNQRGILISAGNGFTLSNINIRNISGIGILQEGGNIGTGSFGGKGSFINIRCKDCWVGRKDSPNFWVGGQPNNYVNEYCTWIGFEADGCEIGSITSAGNNSFIGGKLTANTDGLWLVKSANSTHGVMVGVQINHNKQYNVNIDEQTAGFEFTGCTIYGDSPTQGVVRVVNSRGIKFNGGQFEASVYCDGAYSNILIANVYNNGNFVPEFAGTNPENIYKVNWMSANPSQNAGDFGGYSEYNDIAKDFVFGELFSNVALSGTTEKNIEFKTISNLRKRYKDSEYIAPWKGNYDLRFSVLMTGGNGGLIKFTKNDVDEGGYAQLAYDSVFQTWFAVLSTSINCKQGDKIKAIIHPKQGGEVLAGKATFLDIKTR